MEGKTRESEHISEMENQIAGLFSLSRDPHCRHATSFLTSLQELFPSGAVHNFESLGLV